VDKAECAITKSTEGHRRLRAAEQVVAILCIVFPTVATAGAAIKLATMLVTKVGSSKERASTREVVGDIEVQR
jgi:hypothetical protein